MPYVRNPVGAPPRPFQKIPGAVQVTLKQTYEGKPFVNVVGLVLGGLSLQEGVDWLSLKFATQLYSVFSTHWRYDGAEARDLSDEFAPEVTSTAGAGAVGSVASQTDMPRGVSMAIILHTGAPGRSRMGRIFLCGVAGSYMQNDSTWAPNITADVHQHFQQIQTDYQNQSTLVDSGLAVISRSRTPGNLRIAQPTLINGAWSPAVTPDGSVHVVRDAIPRPRAASQRRRN